MNDASRAAEVKGPVFHPANPVADAAGSIHDDAVARKLGFQGGTIPGDALMDLYPAFLAQQFGRRWFESGSLSLFFRQALEGGDGVRPVVEGAKADVADGAAWDPTADHPGKQCLPEQYLSEQYPSGEQLRTRLETPDGRTIAEGTASVGTTEQPSALFARDLRAVPPEQLRILKQIAPGETIATHRVDLPAARQQERMVRGFGCGFSDLEQPDELYGEIADWHRDRSPWGAPVALPSTAIGLLLYHGPRAALTPRIGDSVGLFGAIELRYRNGPILLDRSYDVTAKVVALSDSPRTEALWFDSDASLADDPNTVVASMRMMLRFMKASSALY
jgi:hypothetical protein